MWSMDGHVQERFKDRRLDRVAFFNGGFTRFGCVAEVQRVKVFFPISVVIAYVTIMFFPKDGIWAGNY